MKISKLPTKLAREPLLEAVFELRFASSGQASTILPGILFSVLGQGKALQMTRLPAADLPSQFREADAAMRFAALVRLEWDPFVVLLSDASVGVACKIPYPGWAAFRPAILKVAGVVARSGIVQRIERYSLKYVDLISRQEVRDQVRAFDWEVRLGNHKLEAESAIVRVEMIRGGVTHAVQIFTAAQAHQGPGTEVRHGAVIDVDSLVSVDTVELETFLSELPTRIDDLHHANKAVFFECLTQEVLDELEPKYE